MRHAVRKLVVFPVMVLGSPLIYFVGWCFEGHSASYIFTRKLLKGVWGGCDFENKFN